MSAIDWLKEKFGGEKNGKVKAKKIKITKKDIQLNLVEIDEQMKKVQDDICRITVQMADLDTSSDAGRERYSELRAKLDDKNEIYSVFQQQQKRNLEHLETLNKTGKTEIVLKAITVVGTIFLSVIGLGLNRESPSILKTIDFIIKPFRAPMKF